jgi:hypothetical protein
MRGMPSTSASRTAFSTSSRAHPPPIHPGRDAADGADHGFGASLGGGYRDGSHHGCQYEGPVLSSELSGDIHYFGMGFHRSPLSQFGEIWLKVGEALKRMRRCMKIDIPQHSLDAGGLRRVAVPSRSPD